MSCRLQYPLFTVSYKKDIKKDTHTVCKKHAHKESATKFAPLNTPCSPPASFSRSNSYDEKSRTGHIFSSKKLYKVKTESLNNKEFAGNNRPHNYTVIFRYTLTVLRIDSFLPLSLYFILFPLVTLWMHLFPIFNLTLRHMNTSPAPTGY